MQAIVILCDNGIGLLMQAIVILCDIAIIQFHEDADVEDHRISS